MSAWLVNSISGSFNPTMVRLLHGVESMKDIIKTVSIPQWCDCCFRSTRMFGEITIVSIPQWCDCCNLLEQIKTKVNEVSIPQWCDCCLDISSQVPFVLHRFNPTMVRLLHPAKFAEMVGWAGFNPTMVRLLLNSGNCISSCWDVFQSHNGAIAAAGCLQCLANFGRFQSHNGAIAA